MRGISVLLAVIRERFNTNPLGDKDLQPIE